MNDDRAKMLADFTSGIFPAVSPVKPAKKERATRKSASLMYHKRRMQPAPAIEGCADDHNGAVKGRYYRAPSVLTNAQHGDKSAVNKLKHAYGEHLARIADPADAINYAIAIMPPVPAPGDYLETMLLRAKSNPIPAKRWLLAYFDEKLEGMLDAWNGHARRDDYLIEVKLAFLRAVDRGEFGKVWNQIELALNVDGARDREQFFARIRQELFDMGARPINE